MTRQGGLPPSTRALLDDAFARPIEQPLGDEEFDRLARAIFQWQFENNAPFAAFCRRRDRTPGSTGHWSDIPAVPTGAFKEVELVAGTSAAADAVFRTSGTTRGERRGVHIIPDISYYNRSLLPNFASMMLPDGVRPAMFSLLPPPRDLPDSSLAHMIGTAMQHLGSHESRWCASVADGIDHVSLERALTTARRNGDIVCLLGTSFSFVNWLDGMRDRGERHRLPDGSRLMDTGGFKGHGREVTASEMADMYLEFLGIPPTHCVNEYGMTELCSQFYDASLRDAILRRRLGPGRKLAPPWVRTRVVDPETLEPVPAGATGLLQHFDLANVGSVLAVQTEDLGVQVENGFRVLGRAGGAQPRGCSIAMDELLAAVRSGDAG